MAKHLCYSNLLTSVTNVTTTSTAAVFSVPYSCRCNSPSTFFLQFPTVMGTFTTAQLAYISTCNKTFNIVDANFTNVPASIFVNNATWLVARVCRNNTRYYQLVNYKYTASTSTPATTSTKTSSDSPSEDE